VAGRLAGASAEVVAAAWLHDVLEDTAVTEAGLRRRFPATVVDAVRALTRAPGEEPDAYYGRVRADAVALQVKRADLASNTDPRRTALLDPVTCERLTRTYDHARTVSSSS
jgi:(p)ppGpp synthase/HD superfamily hydrolase